jgi:hypothetical protein
MGGRLRFPTKSVGAGKMSKIDQRTQCLYFHDIPKGEIRKKGVLSFTTPARTLRDYTGISGDPEILLQALVKGLSLGLFTAFQVAFSSAYVLPYLLAQRP